MRKPFLALSPQNRFARLSQLVQRFESNATRLSAPFTILVYGSASYGLNLKYYGHLDDIDLFLIISREHPAKDILQVARKVFETDFDISVEHLQHLQEGLWEMSRMYGSIGGIKVGFRIMCQDTFRSSLPSRDQLQAFET
jgi:hypothetical protein